MKTPWTPGQWKVEELEGGDWIGRPIFNVVGDEYDIVGCEGLFHSYEIDKANATLIALAPEMAEAILAWDAMAENVTTPEEWNLATLARRLRQIQENQ